MQVLTWILFQELADAIGNDPQFLLTLQNNDAAFASAIGVPGGQSGHGHVSQTQTCRTLLT